MRHRRTTKKLKRTAAHRKALLANLACSLIEHGRIRTTLAKAKALRPYVEKLITTAKKAAAEEEAKDQIHLRRQAIAKLRHKNIVTKLFDEVAPASADRPGGYTRIVKLGARMTDSAPMAYIELVDSAVAVGESFEDDVDIDE